MVNPQDVQTLIDFGVLNEAGLARLAGLIRSIQGLAGVTAAPGRAAAMGPAAVQNGVGRKRRRAAFTATKDDLSKMKSQGMTAKAIAAKLGCSMATVNTYLKKFGLTTGRKGRPPKVKK